MTRKRTAYYRHMDELADRIAEAMEGEREPESL
jgi:hypothetical protein